MTAKNTINMILTSLVNNDVLRNKLVDDIKLRFKVNLDSTKLQNLLNVVDVDVEGNNVYSFNEN